MRAEKAFLVSFVVAVSASVFPQGTLADPNWTKALVESSPVYLKANPGKAVKHVTAALFAAQETGISPEILLGMAYVESRYLSNVVSYKTCTDGSCRRRGAKMRSRHKPAHFKGPYFCGVLQVGGHISWRECLRRMDDVRGTYVEAGHHLNRWLAHPRCARRSTEERRLRCAMLGYAGGKKLIKLADRGVRSKATSYPSRCLHQARLIRRALGRTPAPAL